MIDRRKLIELGLGYSAAGATGVGSGYAYRREINAVKQRISPDPGWSSTHQLETEV